MRVIQNRSDRWDVEVWNPSYGWWDYVRSFRWRWTARLFMVWFRLRWRS